MGVIAVSGCLRFRFGNHGDGTRQRFSPPP